MSSNPSSKSDGSIPSEVYATILQVHANQLSELTTQLNAARVRNDALHRQLVISDNQARRLREDLIQSKAENASGNTVLIAARAQNLSLTQEIAKLRAQSDVFALPRPQVETQDRLPNIFGGRPQNLFAQPVVNSAHTIRVIDRPVNLPQVTLQQRDGFSRTYKDVNGEITLGSLLVRFANRSGQDVSKLRMFDQTATGERLLNPGMKVKDWQWVIRPEIEVKAVE